MYSHKELFHRLLAQTSENPMGLEISHAEGIFLYDPSGRKYLDLVSGVSVNALGHQHPAIKEAIRQQMDKYLHLMVYGEFIQGPQVEYAQLLADHLDPSLQSIYFVNSGSEAIEGAMKLAKRFTGRPEIIAFKNSYHGSSQGALSILGDEHYKRAFRPLLPDIQFLTFNSFNDLERISRRTAGVVVEPVQAEAGVILPGEGFLGALKEQCHRHGALLIFDEVQTGFARMGALFAFQKYEVIPDILVLAKALGGGMPLGAFISCREIMQVLSCNPALGHITTFGGHPVCCAAGKASMQVIMDQNYAVKALQAGERFRKALTHPLIEEVRGTGLLLAVQLDSHTRLHKFLGRSLEKGLISDGFLFNDCSFRISPPLTITREEEDLAVQLIMEILNDIQ